MDFGTRGKANRTTTGAGVKKVDPGLKVDSVLHIHDH